MKFSQVLLLPLALVGPALAVPASTFGKPPYFILVGDSTTASGGGWGDAFLSSLIDPANGTNPAKNGATTVSFKNEGLWDQAVAEIPKHRTDFEPFVTLQFGHNDQKPEKNITLDQFRDNLSKMAQQVKQEGATPIFITSLTRRTFKNGAVVENLEQMRAATIEAAANAYLTWPIVVDLNTASTDYVNAIGEEKAARYDMVEGDKTHLNAAGKKVFGRMVVDLLLRQQPDLIPHFREQQVLSDKIWSGQFATGDE